jgi:hypothetical protein
MFLSRHSIKHTTLLYGLQMIINLLDFLTLCMPVVLKLCPVET